MAPNEPTRPAGAAGLLLLALLAGACASCSAAKGPRLYPVRGQVLYNGRPVAKGLVVFHPLAPTAGAGQKPIAYTDDEGRFRLTTDRPGDGAPAGEYVVTVEWREKTRTGVEKVGGRNLLPARYGKPESSGLRCRVEEGPNELPPLNLTER
jgi:hypothetical protein